MLPEPPPPELPLEVLIPSLPNDVAFNILARLPRRCHVVLSTVSKSLRSAVSSPQLYAARSLLNYTESILYLRVGSFCHIHNRWFSVHRNPNPTKDNRLQLHLAPVTPVPVEARMKGSAYTCVGPKIYVIGGYMSSGKPSSHMWVLDFRTHTWERSPSMLMPRQNAEAAIVDGKVYVFGGCFSEESWVEVLDPVTGRWEDVPGPLDGIVASIFGSKLVNGMVKVLSNGEEVWVYPMTKLWMFFQKMNSMLMTEPCVELDGASYKHDIGWKFERFDERIGVWKELKGVEEGKPKYSCHPGLVNLGGRLVLLFAQVRFGNTIDMEKGKVGVWCTEIDVTENEDGDFWERVHWSEMVPLLPEWTWATTEDDFFESIFVYFFHHLSVSV